MARQAARLLQAGPRAAQHRQETLQAALRLPAGPAQLPAAAQPPRAELHLLQAVTLAVQRSLGAQLQVA